MLRQIIGIIESPLDILTCTSDELRIALSDERSFTSHIVKEGEVLYDRLNNMIGYNLLDSCLGYGRRAFFARPLEKYGHFISNHVQTWDFIPVLFDRRVYFQCACQSVAVNRH